MAVTLSLTITQNSQNITNNTSNVTVNVVAAWTYGSWNATGQCKCNLTIDGINYQFTGISFNTGQTTTGSQVVATKTLNISHDAAGEKTLACSAWFETGVSSGTVLANGSKTLTTIPRTSTPTLSSYSVDMGGKVTIYTNRKSDKLTHDLAYSFAGGSYVSIATGVGASYTWTTPDLPDRIPNASSGTVTIRCTTKNGGASVGTATVVLTLKVPTGLAPTITSVTVAEATPGLAAQFGAYIRNKSTLKVNITAAGVDGSTIKEYKVNVAGAVYQGQSVTTNVVNAQGNVNVIATVTDSRGRTASKTVTIAVLAYSAPTVSEFKAFRCDANGNPKDDGIYMSVSYAYSVTSLNGKNTASMVIEYKTKASDSWSTLTTGSDLESSATRAFTDGPVFSTDYQYDIRLTVTDWFGASASYSNGMPTADVVLDISDDGTGLGFGKVSQRSDAIEFARTMYDKFDTLIGNGLARYRDDDGEFIDPNVTQEHLIVTNVNTPDTDFWYVLTLFYSTKSDTANRVQLALPYVNALVGSGIFVRTYNGGRWSSWSCTPYIREQGTYSDWDYVIWSDRRVELTKTYEISNMACTTSLGTWYRTAVFEPGRYFPVGLKDIHVDATYESDGYGALLWATTEATSTSTPSYYLIRPTSATIVSGKVHLRVTGRQS